MSLPVSDQITQLMREIDEAARQTFDLATREKAKRKAGSRRDAYEKALTEVRNVAGRTEAAELADWITTEMRTEHRYPSARDVRQEGARICRESGHEVSTGNWLGA